MGLVEFFLFSVDENYDNGEVFDVEVMDGVFCWGGWVEMWIGCEINMDKGWRRWVFVKGFCCLGVMVSFSWMYYI